MSSQGIDKLRAYLGARLRTRWVCSFYHLSYTERQIEATKEFLLHVFENEIDRSQIVDKEGVKERLREWCDASARGIKDELRSIGRLIR